MGARIEPAKPFLAAERHPVSSLFDVTGLSLGLLRLSHAGVIYVLVNHIIVGLNVV
jgi:hypothetical protein